MAAGAALSTVAAAFGGRWDEAGISRIAAIRNGFTNRNAYRGYNGGYRQRSFNGRDYAQPRSYRQRDFGYASAQLQRQQQLHAQYPPELPRQQ